MNRHITRRDALRTLGLGAGMLAGGSLLENAWAGSLTRGGGKGRPNFLVILADDMGFADAGCYGGEIQTPVIDSLAQNGVRFTQFYNTGRCMPTRTCLMTGRYYEQWSKKGPPMTLPHYLRPLGYRSYFYGKWGNWCPELGESGFDVPGEVYWRDNYFREGGYHTTAITDRMIKTLTEHGRKHRGKPFFAYMAYQAPHFPLHALEKDIKVYEDRYRVGWDVIRKERWQRQRKMGLVNCDLPPLEEDLEPRYWRNHDRLDPADQLLAIPWDRLTEQQKRHQARKMAIHAAMVHRMDIEIGRLVKQLKAMRQYENTVIMFMSDNGTDATVMVRGKHDRSAEMGSRDSYLCLGPGWSSAGNTPFRMHKIWNHEGGITTPLVVHWPAGIKARGELRHDLGHVLDIPPTLISLAGGEPKAAPDEPPISGKNLAPAFHKDGAVSREFLYFNHERNRALRGPKWKIVSAPEHGKDWQLYDMSTDRCEMKDLAERHPDIVKKMGRQWQDLTRQYANDARAASQKGRARKAKKRGRR